MDVYNKHIYMYLCVYSDICIYIYMYVYLCIYIFIYMQIYAYIYRLPLLPPTSQMSIADDFCVYFEGSGLPGVLPTSRGCTGVDGRAKVGYLELVCGREHRVKQI